MGVSREYEPEREPRARVAETGEEARGETRKEEEEESARALWGFCPFARESIVGFGEFRTREHCRVLRFLTREHCGVLRFRPRRDELAERYLRNLRECERTRARGEREARESKRARESVTTRRLALEARELVDERVLWWRRLVSPSSRPPPLLELAKRGAEVRSEASASHTA